MATIGEVEVFVDHGADDVFITYPLWIGTRQADRLRQLADRARIAVGAGTAEGASNTGARLADAAGAIDVLIEIDSGHHRSGVRAEQVLEVAHAVGEAGLHLVGVFTFPGHSYAPGKPGEAGEQERRALNDAANALVAVGFPISCRSGGPLPPHCSPPRTGPPRRPGVYVLGDAQQLELGRCAPADIALTVAATVVSRQDCRSGLRRIVLDCGSKILGSDRPAWATGFGRLIDHADARIAALSEHHATVVWPDDAPLPPVGTRLRVIPNHVCLTTNLVDDVAVVRDATLIDRWKVAARGKNH
ncbi:Conserved protein of uncharacterised function%2C possible alanine racemase%2C N-terminal domain protein [Mycobacterium tuberculosis]|nr:Conserved protein of uncharacterised function%2C possible alanine racemase%2C N-terminal domain protein [Mycobacterium tuberculosis]